MIACSENCIHADDGLCNKSEVSKPSSTPIKDCPYFQEKLKNEGGAHTPP